MTPHSITYWVLQWLVGGELNPGPAASVFATVITKNGSNREVNGRLHFG